VNGAAGVDQTRIIQAEESEDIMGLVRLFAAIVGIGILTTAQPSVACSNATLNDTYGFILNGVNKAHALTATVGQITADGKGGLTGSETVSNNGVIVSDVSLTGSYSLHWNCTGTATITPAGGTASHYSLTVIANQIEMAETDQGFTEYGYAQLQGNANCSDAGLKGITGFQGGGFYSGSSLTPIAFAGQVKADGLGNMSGTEKGSFGGTVFSTSISGTYAVNANCTGTAAFTDTHGNATHFNFVLVNGGMSLLQINTNAGAIVTSTAIR
jgi:hypothetical protein